METQSVQIYGLKSDPQADGGDAKRSGSPVQSPVQAGRNQDQRPIEPQIPEPQDVEIVKQEQHSQSQDDKARDETFR